MAAASRDFSTVTSQNNFLKNLSPYTPLFDRAAAAAWSFFAKKYSEDCNVLAISYIRLHIFFFQTHKRKTIIG